MRIFTILNRLFFPVCQYPCIQLPFSHEFLNSFVYINVFKVAQKQVLTIYINYSQQLTPSAIHCYMGLTEKARIAVLAKHKTGQFTWIKPMTSCAQTGCPTTVLSKQLYKQRIHYQYTHHMTSLIFFVSNAINEYLSDYMCNIT